MRRVTGIPGATIARDPCPGCGALFPDVAGPTHRYMESSPGCRAAYGVVFAREYGDRAYFEVHRLSADAYAVQHSGRRSQQAIQSVGFPLSRGCLFLERGLAAEDANDAMLANVKARHRFAWLAQPGRAA